MASVAVAEKPVRLSVVIPHLNTPRLLELCLHSVIDQHMDHGSIEVIVVDNGSSMPLDDVMARFPDVRFLVETKAGPGLARNRGASVATASFLAFIDADCIAAPNWAKAVVDSLEGDFEDSIIGGEVRIAVTDRNLMTGIEAYEVVFGFRQRWYIEKKFFSVTANLAMPATIFAAVGPFAGIDLAEDLDWGRRAKIAGFATHYVGSMSVFHPARPDFGSMAQKYRRIIAHDYAHYRKTSRSNLKWHLRMVAMALSTPVHALRIANGAAVGSLANRMRGIVALAQIRGYRCKEMVRVSRNIEAGKPVSWNR